MDSGTLAVQYGYDPLGKVLSGTGSNTAIANLNLQHYRNYYYDNEIGCFINADTYTTTDADGLLSTNMFAYCENNPVMGVDPTGEWVHLAAGAVTCKKSIWSL